MSGAVVALVIAMATLSACSGADTPGPTVTTTVTTTVTASAESTPGATSQSTHAQTTAPAETTEPKAAEAPLDAHALAKAIKQEVGSVKKTVDLTVDTDVNKQLGRPHGYTSATVIFDDSGTCEGDPGVSCGATVEVFANAKDAKARYDYIDKVTAAASVFAEYDTHHGTALLRVDGAIKPSHAKKYKTAFLGAF